MQQCFIINMLRPAISSLVHLDVQLAALLCPPVTDKTKWSRLQVGIVSQDLNKAGPQTTGSQRLAAESTSECNRRQTVFKTRGRTLTFSRWRRRDIFSPQNRQGGWTRAGRGTECWPSTHRVCLCVIWTVWGLWTLRDQGFRDVARRVLILMELLDRSSWTEAAFVKVHQPSVTKQVWLHHKPKNKTVCGHRLCWILWLRNPDWVYPAADKSPP